MAGPLIYDDAYAVLCLGAGSRPGRRTVLGPLIHDDPHHGAGKRWDGTRYTCSGCRLFARQILAFHEELERMTVTAAEARLAFEDFAAAMPVLSDEN